MPINYQPSSFSSINRDSMRGPDGSGLPLNGTIMQRRDLNDGLTVLTIALHGWELPPFEAGQYIDIALQTRSTIHQSVQLDSTRFEQNELIRRSYSIASSPQRLDQVELLLNLVPRGEFTPQLWRLDEGSRVHVNPRVRGRFNLSAALKWHGDDDEGSWPVFHPHLIFIATGTGIAPYMSMLRSVEDNDPPWASATLLHSVRHAEDLPYQDELKFMADNRGFRFTYIPTITRPADGGAWQGETGRVQEVLEPKRYKFLTNGRSIRPEDTHIFLCGNPEMINDLRDKFEADGFTPHTTNTPGNLHFESYW